MTWRERIVAARELGDFEMTDKMLAYSSWMTCAVGEQRVQHPEVVKYVDLSDHGGPEDQILYLVGNQFGEAVWMGEFSNAEVLLDQIENRVLELKRGV